MANHNEVAHAWANQTGRACKGFNMFYEDRTIYSYGYHFPIARICDDGECADPAILFASKGYSVSTAKHKSIVSRAIDHHHYRVFVVENVNARTPAQHLANWEASIKQAREAMGRAKRARKNASWYLDDAEQCANRCNEYSDAFNLGLSRVSLETLDAAAGEAIARAEAMRKEAELARAKAERERALRDRERLRAWLQGADVFPPHTRVPYVRVKGDAVETTWGATVPLHDALGLWGMMKHARATHSAREFLEKRIGDFRLTSVTPTGARVGCHYIPFKYAQLAAYAAGLA